MDSDVAAICRTTGLPFVYKVWPAEMVGSLQYPHLRYWRAGSERFVADNTTYCFLDEYEILLVTERKDEASELLVENALSDAGVVASNTSETLVSDERLFQVSWTFRLIRK